MSRAYGFRPVTLDDFPLLEGWMRLPHVAEWWGKPQAELEQMRERLADPTMELLVVELDQRPIGYLQSYDPQRWDDHHFADQPAGARGVDQYLGEPDLLGQGHGSAFLDAFCRRLFAQGVPRVLIDPSPDNARAIRAYEKAGFSAYGEARTQSWGHLLLMARDAETPRNP